MAKNGYGKLMEVLLANQGTMQEMLTAQTATLAALQQKVGDTHDRLFGEEGAIPRLGAGIKRVDGELSEAVKELSAADYKLDKKVTWYAGIAVGVGATLSTIVKAIGAKLGLHF